MAVPLLKACQGKISHFVRFTLLLIKQNKCSKVLKICLYACLYGSQRLTEDFFVVSCRVGMGIIDDVMREKGCRHFITLFLRIFYTGIFQTVICFEIAILVFFDRH